MPSPPAALAMLLLAYLPLPQTGDAAPPFTVQKHGSGKTKVILIPGLGCDASVWKGTVKRFKNDCTLYTVTLAGFGGTGPLQAPYIEKWTAGLAKWIKARRLRTPVIVGHSLGGNIGLRLAIKHPELIGRVIVVDGMPIFPPLKKGETIDLRKKTMRNQTDRMISVDKDSWKQMTAFSAAFLVGNKEARAVVEKIVLQADRKTFAGAVYELSTTDLRDDLKKIKVPVTVLVPVPKGDKNETAADARKRRQRFEDLYRDVFRRTPQLKLIVIPDSRHFIMYDQPGRMYEALRKSLPVK